MSTATESDARLLRNSYRPCLFAETAYTSASQGVYSVRWVRRLLNALLILFALEM